MEKGSPLSIHNIWQKDNETFCIEWNDGIASSYRLSALQSQCPCAACVDEKTGQRLAGVTKIREDVRAVKISSVGRYALRIQFTQGCSNGIFSFDMLRNL
jgi:DUF971 family protein